MKRLLSVVLVLLVGIVPMAAVANQERGPVEHLLWDIPFGIGVEECLALVKERTGVEFTDSDGSDSYVIYSAYWEQGMTFLNYPADLKATFDVREDKLMSFDVVIMNGEKWNVSIFPGEDEALDKALVEEGFVRSFREVMEFCQEIGSLYGPSTGGRMAIDTRGGESHTYSFPMRNGVLDAALVEKVFAEIDEDWAGGALYIWHDNVEVMVSVSSTRQWYKTGKRTGIWLTYSAWGSFNEEEAYSFEGKDGEHPFWEKEERGEK